MSNRVFVYGTLMPGGCRWSSVAPYVEDAAIPAQVSGQLLDTGYGYPGLVLTGSRVRVPGWLLTMDPASSQAAMELLDAIEGTGVGLYRRIEVVTESGLACWTYEFLCLEPHMAALPRGWPGAPTFEQLPR